MSRQLKASPGRLLVVLMVTVAFAAVVGQATCALAADPTAPLDAAATAQLLQQLGSSQVDEAICTTLCHGNIAQTKNYASAIKFSHGNHIIVQCSACHSKFPHQQNGTQRPTMKGCWDCHGLRHGSMGIIAKNDCPACHITPRAQMVCPYSKTISNWAGAGHKVLGDKMLNTDCMRCHTSANCTDCHGPKGVTWQPKTNWDYDSNNGCQSCHGSSNLLKQDNGVAKSFQVQGVDESVHRDNTCQQCHVDYRYDDKPAATKLWNVNAGLECGTCHATLPKSKDSSPVALYEQSIHSQKIQEAIADPSQGNLNSATCGSCHGGHFIYNLDTAEGKARMHASALRVCARCHLDKYVSYNDYYHGQAYKRGAPDAPACWDCHASHDVLPKADSSSTVNAANVGNTCGQAGCHKGSSESFGTQADQLIHRKVTAVQTNPVLEFISNIFNRNTSQP